MNSMSQEELCRCELWEELEACRSGAITSSAFFTIFFGLFLLWVVRNIDFPGKVVWGVGAGLMALWCAWCLIGRRTTRKELAQLQRDRLLRQVRKDDAQLESKARLLAKQELAALGVDAEN